jgi:hypothetical protein
VASGQDPHVVEAILQSFQKEFEPLLKAGQLEEAEAAIDPRLYGLNREGRSR